MTTTSESERAPATRLVFGPGVRRTIGELARELGARRVLLVTDPGLVQVGHAREIEGSLRSAGCEVKRFAGVRANPTTRDVEECLAQARALGPDLFVALGGGSPIDVAKGANMLLTNGGRMQDYRGRARTTKPLLPLVAVPTTAGTGSEVQTFALIADEETHQKMACGAADGAAFAAVLDPELTLTLPPFPTACSGLDAIGHALESAVTTERTKLSGFYARGAWQLAARALPIVLAKPADLEARGDMQLGAAWAGLAIENSMLGAAHAMANPLTTRHAIEHGLAVALALPHVVRFNAEEPGARAIYATLARAADRGASEDEREAALSLAEKVRALLAAAGLDARLTEHGVRPEDVPALAAEAAQQWTAQFNPRRVGVPELRGLYEAALAG